MEQTSDTSKPWRVLVSKNKIRKKCWLRECFDLRKKWKTEHEKNNQKTKNKKEELNGPVKVEVERTNN